jgi:tetratricopeptide (TPR) repeat protein
MTDLQQKSLQGAALYNPHLHGKQELVGLFFVRRKLLDLLLEDLRATSAGQSPQHHLLIGQRGMGKTMLLHRLGYGIEDDPELSQSFLPLTFPEEQYNVARLSDFWLNCTDALSDTLERMGRSREADDLDEKAEALRLMEEKRRSKQALALLTGTAKALGRRLVLLIDNIDLILDRVHQQDWDLREALSDQSSLVLIGASANAVESSYTYDQAFYDFFRIHELEGLDLEETRRLIIHYAEIWNTPDVKRLAEGDAPRIRVLHNLTGGNPRTIALLYNVLALGVEGDVRSDLEKLLDQCTPLYKARFEALPPQAQQVVHAMAVHWDPISAGELAESMAMEVNAVSSQLARLVKQGVVEKVEYDPESKTGFQIAERFFNIWYLMRASRRVRRRLLWLVEFLRIFYDQEQLQAKAFAHIQSGLSLDPNRRLRYAEYSFALADAVADRAWRRSLEKAGLHALLRDDTLRGQLAELIDLEGEPSLKKPAEYQQRFEQTRSSVVSAQLDLAGWSGEDFWVKLRNSLLFPLEEKVWIAENLSNLERDLVAFVKSQLNSESEVLETLYVCPQTVGALAKAVHTGLMTDTIDLEGAIHVESVLGASGLRAVALAHRLDLTSKVAKKPDRKLLAQLEKVLETTTSPFPWLVWLQQCAKLKKFPSLAKLRRAIHRVVVLAKGRGEVVVELGEALIALKLFPEAEAVLKEFLAENPHDARIWFELGTLYSLWLERAEEGEKALRISLELDSGSANAWNNLGFTLQILERYGEAAEVQRKAIELDPENATKWRSLGDVLGLLGLYEEAEEVYRKAIKLDSEDTFIWMNFGVFLGRLRRHEEAEQALRKGIALNDSFPFLWANLGMVLKGLGRNEEAEQAYRKSIELAPYLSELKSELAWFLLLDRGNYEAAETLAKDALDDGAYGVLAATLMHRGDWIEAAEHAKRSILAVIDRDVQGSWPRTLVFFREAVRAGKAREAANLLEEIGVAERWRPLREALEAIARGKDSYLRRVAPEVRQPARQILKQLREELPWEA